MVGYCHKMLELEKNCDVLNFWTDIEQCKIRLIRICTVCHSVFMFGGIYLQYFKLGQFVWLMGDYSE